MCVWLCGCVCSHLCDGGDAGEDRAAEPPPQLDQGGGEAAGGARGTGGAGRGVGGDAAPVQSQPGRENQAQIQVRSSLKGRCMQILKRCFCVTIISLKVKKLMI